MGQSLFNKNPKFQKFDEILHSRITRFKNVKSKFQKFILSNFTLTWSNDGKINNICSHITYSKELQQKMNLSQKTIELNIFSKILGHAYIYEQQSFSDGYCEESLPESNYKNIEKYGNSTVAIFSL